MITHHLPRGGYVATSGTRNLLPPPGTPAQLDKFVAEQLVIARDLAQKAGIKPE